MTRRLFAASSLGRYFHSTWYQSIWQSISAAPKTRQRRRRGVLQFESLDARRVMHGEDLFDFGEGEAGSVVEAFSLTDVNTASDTFNQPVSPGDFTQQASAWYFGHST